MLKKNVFTITNEKQDCRTWCKPLWNTNTETVACIVSCIYWNIGGVHARQTPSSGSLAQGRVWKCDVTPSLLHKWAEISLSVTCWCRRPRPFSSSSFSSSPCNPLLSCSSPPKFRPLFFNAPHWCSVWIRLVLIFHLTLFHLLAFNFTRSPLSFSISNLETAGNVPPPWEIASIYGQ